jgi:hypothetical protein
MRVNGSFTDNYNRLLEMNKQLGDDVEEHLLVWARDVVDTLKALNKKATYKVVITLEPNPSDEKGTDNAKIEVWQTDQSEMEVTLQDHYWVGAQHKPFIKVMSGRRDNLATCIKEVNERMDNIAKRLASSDIIEKDGKKYRLVEIK